MEAVPRLPMIWFQLKISPEPTTFGPKLKQYIRDFYNEDAESYANEIHQLESLRAMAVRPPVDMAGCLLLKKYYSQLHFLQSRFPMGKDGAAAVTFTWRDTYSNMVCSLANIRFEIISILYNIGSMHTQLGARTERTSADGMKMACAHFQCAAWAFDHLKNSYPQPSGVDLAPELMTFMHQLCLAQAQECILEKSMLDNRKPTIVAKVARQIVDYFTLALTTLEQGGSEDGTISDTVGTKIYKCWKRYVKFKKAYHLAVTHLYQGLAAEEQRKMGERVAFYNVSLASLNEAHSICANVKGSIGITGASEEKTAVEEALTFTNDVIEGKRKAAKNENEFIYHEEVPEKETLPTVKGASLVKGISFSINDTEVSGPDIFARLVPMKVHEASSLYSEEKAKILRSVGAKIEEKDQQLNTYLASLKLEHMSLWDPDVQTTEWERLPLPDDLIERCAALNAKQHIIQELVDIMGKLSDTSQDVEKVLKEIKKLLLDEELKEKQYQDTVGKRPPSIVATDLTREAKKYEEAHSKASESNHALHKAITMHVKNLNILGQPLADLVSHIPSPSAYLSEQNTEKSHSAIELERMHTKELKRILNKVDEMRRQRNDLHAKLRDSIAQDDLTRLLVTATSDSGPLDRLFADQLSKHQALVNLIEQNLAAQDNILAALTDAYAQTANVRKGVEEILKRRELTISSLVASYDAYEDLLAKSSKGLEFYRKLEINISKLLQRVKSTCKVQEEEREQILAAQDSKNLPENSETVAATTYEPRARPSSGLKLKDYLNSRTENLSSQQNQYYKLYKGQSKIDQETKAIPEVDQSLVQPPGMADPAATMKPGQHYYPTYNPDYKTSLTYSYGVGGHAYSDSPIMSSGLSQNYMQPNNAPEIGGYTQPTVPGASADLPNPAMQYPMKSFVSNEQVFPQTLDDRRDKYNLPGNMLQYEPTYQPPMDYTEYNMMSQFAGNVDKTTAMAKNEPQIPAISHTSVSTSIGQTGSVDGQAQLYNTRQQYVVPQDTSQNIRNHVLPVVDPQGYSHPQVNQNEVAQNYETNVYYNPQDVHPQQAAALHNTAGANISSAQYIPMQYANPQPGRSSDANSLTTPDREASAAFPSNLHSSNAVQYTQQGCAEQTDQNYVDKTYLSYGSQVPVNDTALCYPSAHQSLHPAGIPYQQNPMIAADVASAYGYSNCSTTPEIIQSHTKYQYPAQQQHYPGYGPCASYSPYNHGFNYIQGNQMGNTGTESYKDQAEYAYDPANQAQCYYNLNNQHNSQPVQMLPAHGLMSQANGGSSNSYQQQETNARYTNASNNAMVSETASSEYSQGYQPQNSTDIYYTMPYGIQTQNQGPTGKTETHTNYNQTYMQAVNNGTNTTTSANPVKTTTKSANEEQSNVDLLSDLDVTINHAPLVPEVRPLNKMQEEQPTVNNVTENDHGKDKKNDEPRSTENTVNVAEEKPENENLQIVWDTWYNDVQPKKDPLGDPAALQKFISEVEKYEKFVDSLLVKTLSGATNLDIKWKEVQDFEERESGKQSCTVALAHSSENRVMDCIPYDTRRVQISSTDTSTYINASHVMEITQWIPTAFIVTQTPLPDKLEVFWTMIWEQECEVIACLVSDAQLNGEVYWPVSEEDTLNVGNFTVSLNKRVNHISYIQRIISIQHAKKKSEKTVVHMQFITWPSNGFPSSPGALLTFATDVMTEQAMRRCSPKPVLVHCVDGGSLSSLFLVAATTVCHIRAGCGIVDVPLVFKGLLKCRKQVVNKESLLFAYRLVLYHAQDILMKRGILSSTRSTFENFEGFKGGKDKASRKMHPSDDFLHSLAVAAQRPDSEQQGGRQKNQDVTSTSMQEKPNEGVVDPLSQLDPLWSIRR